MLCFFFFNDTATTEIYTLSLHDALPICRRAGAGSGAARAGDGGGAARGHAPVGGRDRCESGGGMVAPGPRGAARGGPLPRRGGTARERRAVRVRGRPRLVPAARAAARPARADPPAGNGRAGGSGVGLGPRSGEEGRGNPKGLPGGRGEGWRRRGYRYRMRVHRPQPRGRGKLRSRDRDRAMLGGGGARARERGAGAAPRARRGAGRRSAGAARGRALPRRGGEPAVPHRSGVRCHRRLRAAVRAARSPGERTRRSGGDARSPRGRAAGARAGWTAGARDRRAPRRRGAGAGAGVRVDPRRRARGSVRPAALRAGLRRGGRVIDPKALELGRLLGQTDEYKAFLRASERLREEAACRQQLAEVERLAQEIERAAQEGREPPREAVEQYDRALQSLQANPVYQAVVAAQANFEKLMTKINAKIFEGMKQGSASPIVTLG